MTISGVIIAKNEEDKIAGAVKSIKWCDEVVVIDNGSEDKTAILSKKAGARVVDYSRGAYREAREKAIRVAKGKWIFYLDADEKCTSELKREIQEIVKDPEYEAYAIPRRNIIWGKEFKHSGQWPDYVKRLFLKSKLKGWRGEVHEEPEYEGEMGHLKGPIIHNQERTLSGMVEKTNWWSEIEAKLMKEANHPPMNVPRFASAVLREFWLRFVKQLAFLDGKEGVVYGLYQVYSRFVSYAKLWEMQENESSNS